jgi:hypothetical protein
VEINGVAALRCWPVDVRIGDGRHRILARPAVDWIVAITGPWTDVVPGLVDIADLTLAGRILRGEVTLAQLVSAAKDAVTAASGLPWWVASRLVAASVGQAALAGALVGVDATRVSLAAWCAAAYRALVEGADDKQLAKIDRELNETPPGVSVEERYDEAAAADAFERMAARRR